MNRLWSQAELQESWTLDEDDRDRGSNMDEIGHLGFVAQLAFYRVYARFPEHRDEFFSAVLLHLARQIGMATVLLRGYEWSGRTGRRHREAILKKLGMRSFDESTAPELRNWLINEALPPSRTMTCSTISSPPGV